MAKESQSSVILQLIRQLEMREKRQAETLADTRAQLEALKKQVGLA